MSGGLLSDEDIFGHSGAGALLSDEDIFGPARRDGWVSPEEVRRQVEPQVRETLAQGEDVARGVPRGAIGMGGSALRGGAGLIAGGQQNSADFNRRQIEIMNRIDAGETVPPTEDAAGYQDMDPAQRREARAQAEQAAAAFNPGRVQDSPVFQAGEAVTQFGRDLSPPVPGREQTVGAGLGEGLGSIVAGIIGSVATGPAGAGALFALTGAGEAVDRAVEAGATEDQIIQSAKAGLIPGLTDSIPVEMILGRIPIPGIGSIQVPPGLAGAAMRAMSRIGAQAFIEGVQEGGQQFLQNAIAREIHSPDASLGEGVAGGAAMGAGVGALAEIIFTPFRRRGADAGRQPAPSDIITDEQVFGPAPDAQGSPPAAEPVEPAPMTPAAPEAAPAAPMASAAVDDDAAYLIPYGDSVEDILDMNDAERAARRQEAIADGVQPIAPEAARAQMDEARRATESAPGLQPEPQPVNPRLNAGDVESPIATETINEGKNLIDEVLANPQAATPRDPTETPRVGSVGSAPQAPAGAQPEAPAQAPQSPASAPQTVPSPETAQTPAVAAQPAPEPVPETSTVASAEKVQSATAARLLLKDGATDAQGTPLVYDGFRNGRYVFRPQGKNQRERFAFPPAMLDDIIAGKSLPSGGSRFIEASRPQAAQPATTVSEKGGVFPGNNSPEPQPSAPTVRTPKNLSDPDAPAVATPPAGQSATDASQPAPLRAKPPRKKREPKTITEFLASRGGISADDPLVRDVRDVVATAKNKTNRMVPGFGPLIQRAKGQSLDALREGAAGAGFFNEKYGNAAAAVEKSTIRDLIDLIDREMRGGRTAGMRTEDAADAESAREAERAEEETARVDEARQEIIDAVAQAGIGEARIDEVALYRASIMLATRQESDPLDAFVEATMQVAREEEGAGTFPGPVVSDMVDDIPGFDDAFERPETAAQSRDPAVPGERDVAGQEPEGRAEGRGSGVQPAQDRVPQGTAGPEADTPADVAPPDEFGITGAENDAQIVIAGTGRRPVGEAQAVAAQEREREETRIRQQQSALRRPNQRRVEDDEGSMFGERRADMLDAPAQPVAKPAPTAAAPTSAPRAEKIEDFGQKLEGARKDFAQKMRDAMAVDIAAEPLAKSWPEPDYQSLLDGGADPWAVAFMHAARDEVPPKPRVGWKLKQWVDQVEMLRRITMDIARGDIDPDRAQTMLEERKRSIRAFRDLDGRIELYRTVGHSKSLKGVRVRSGSYSLFNGVKYDPPLVRWTVEREAKATAFGNWPSELASGATREEAIADFKRRYQSIDTQPEAKKQTSYSIYAYRSGPKAGGFWIGKKLGKEYLDLRKFPDAKAARAFLKTNADELDAQLERMKEIPPERKETNAPRVGHDHRGGADVTPERFQEAFGFRGVQFGNYVEGERRQSDLNDAYDALMDLAGLLGVPTRALSLNGELGLAFGARGKGGKRPASAHYEPDSIVINLTKNKGAGSLAHEWWHAVDNYFSRQRADKDGYLSERAYPRGEGVRPEVVAAFKDLVATINQTALKQRSRALDKRRTKAYWSTGREMSARAFESYIVARLQDQGAANDYLANIVSEDYWNAAAALGMEDGGSYPYLTAAEIPDVRAAFDALFNTIETRETDQGVQMFALRREVTNTPAFRRWFGKSKVVDENGEPLVVYHGTRDSFDAFQTSAEGIHFGTQPQAQMRNRRNLVDAYLSIQKPKRVRDTSGNWAKAVKAAKAQGYDGIVYLNRYEGIPFERFESLRARGISDARMDAMTDAEFRRAVPEASDSYIAFRPEQIKSATGNRGTFDPNDANITAALRRDDAGTFAIREEAGPVTTELVLTDRFVAASRDLETRLRATLDAMGLKDVAVRVPEAIRFLIGGGAYVADGRYHRGIIDVALDTADAGRTLRHEAIHAMRKMGLFTDSEWSILSAKSRREWMGKYKIAEAYGGFPEWAQVEEGVAHAFADRNTETGMFRRLLDRIANFLEALGNALRGAGFQSAEDIFQRAASGEIGARPRDAFGRFASPDGEPAFDMRRPQKAPQFETFEARSAHELAKAMGSWDGLMQAENWKDLFWLARKTFQDDMAPLLRQQRAVEAVRGETPVGRNPYLAAELYRGRAGTRLQRFFNDQMKPILALMRSEKIAPEEIQDYLFARHVPERNRQIAKLYEIEQPDHEFARAAIDDSVAGGSGFSNAWAAKTLAKFNADPRAAAFKAIAQAHDAIHRERMKESVETGLLSQAEVEARQKAYQFYTPMRGFEGEEAEAGWDVGRGFDQRGKDKRAMGRKSRADDPLAYTFMLGAQTILRSEKNKVGRAFLNFVMSNPNKDAWEVTRSEKVNRIRTVLVVDKDTGLPTLEGATVMREVVRSENQPPSRLAENVLIVKVGGKEVAITIHNRDIAAAMKNLDAERMNIALGALAKVTRVLSALNTSWNIEWFVTNLARDLQAAAIQVSDAEKKNMTRDMLVAWPKALKGVFEHNIGRHNSQWAKIARDFEDAGGKVSYIDFRSVEELKDIIEREGGPDTLAQIVARGARAPLDAIEVITSAGENAIRIAAYQTALDKGMPRAKAASLARNLTVDFNKRGTMGPTLNAFYMFFNAAVQGNARLAKSVMRSKFTQKALAGVVGIGFLEALMGLGDDDEYEKIEPYIRERNFVIMLSPLGLGEKGSYIKIPIPYGFNVFKVMGTELGRSVLHGQDATLSASNVFGAAINSFNPIGGQDMIAVLMPTVLDPVVEIARNQNFMGSQIAPNFPGDNRPASEQAFPNVNPIAQTFSRWLNNATGGNDFREGALSINPEHIEHLFRSYFGGVGRLATNSQDAIINAVAGRDVEPERTPFLRQVFGRTVAEMPTWRAYRALSLGAEQLEFEINGLTKAGDIAGAREARERDPVMLRAIPMLKTTDRMLADIRKQERETRASALDDDAKQARLDALRQRSYEIQRRAIERFDTLR